jgi:hypothetical protein
MSLSYLRHDCHKQAVTHIRESRRFESMYNLQGKTRPTWHVRFLRQSTYAGVRFLRLVSVRGNLSRAVNRVEQGHCF